MRLKKKSEQLKKQPYSDVERGEVPGIKGAIRDREYFGHISKPVADSYIKKAEISAGIAQKKRSPGEPTETEMAAGGYDKYLARKSMKSEIASKVIHFQKPTAGKQIADSEHESLYKKVRKIFSWK